MEETFQSIPGKKRPWRVSSRVVKTELFSLHTQRHQLPDVSNCFFLVSIAYQRLSTALWPIPSFFGLKSARYHSSLSIQGRLFVVDNDWVFHIWPIYRLSQSQHLVQDKAGPSLSPAQWPSCYPYRGNLHEEQSKENQAWCFRNQQASYSWSNIYWCRKAPV